MTRTDRSRAGLRVGALVAAATLLLAACSGTAATAPTSAPTAAPAASTAGASGTVYEVKVAQDPKLGPYLTGEDGKSLYLLTADSNGKATCSGGCATAWPPFELDPGESVAAGSGVTGTLATLTRADDGKPEVTYNGIPLYYFAKDAKAGDINGQGVKGVWFLVAPASTASGGAITGGVGQGAATAPSSAPSASAADGYTRGPAATPSAAAGGATASSAKIANYAFAPASLTVKVGATVTWTNSDGVAHTVTADGGAFDSHSISSGGSFKETFTKAGTYAYHCAIHTSMTGSVTVTP
jgi:plastocyanin/predicted lipoprotein with Yx(FWY)xxD motif